MSLLAEELSKHSPKLPRPSSREPGSALLSFYFSSVPTV